MLDFLWQFSKDKKECLDQIFKLKKEKLQLKKDLEKERKAHAEEVAGLRMILNGGGTKRKPPRRKEHGCGKRCFRSASQARKANRSNGKRLRPYYCKACNAYHVASRE